MKKILSIVIILSTYLQAQIPTSGLVAYYPFNGNANDLSINGNHGIISGGVTFVADQYGNSNSACRFNGSNGFISVPNSTSLQLNGKSQLTISVWFKCISGATIPLVGKNNAANTIPQYSLHLNPFSIIRFGIKNTGGQINFVSKSYSFEYNKWYLISATWDGTVSKIYINDNLISTDNYSLSMLVDNFPLEIGRDIGGATEWFNGEMDEIRIYDRALSASEITSIFSSNSTNGNINNGLVAYYPFNGNANDESGNGNNASVYAATLTSDKDNNTNKACGFNGNNNYLRIQNNNALNFQSNLTLSAWIKFSTGGTQNPRIICKGMGGYANLYSYDLFTNGTSSNRKISFTIYSSTGSGVEIQSNSVLNEEIWYFVCATYDGINMKLYINSVLDNTRATNTLISQTTADVYIGSKAGSADFYKGSIDEIRIYNRAITENEIQQLYGSDNSTGLIAYYPFNGNANDESGNGNNGNVNGATLVPDRNGNSNSAYSFNGTSNYITIPNSTSLNNITNQITISGWIYINEFYNGLAPFVTKSNTSELTQYGILIYNRDGAWAFEKKSGGATIADVLSKNAWHFIAITWDGTSVKFYRDGNLLGTKQLSGAIIPNQMPLILGMDTPGQTEYLNGKLDDIRIHNRALTENEISELYGGSSNTYNLSIDLMGPHYSEPAGSNSNYANSSLYNGTQVDSLLLKIKITNKQPSIKVSNVKFNVKYENQEMTLINNVAVGHVNGLISQIPYNSDFDDVSVLAKIKVPFTNYVENKNITVTITEVNGSQVNISKNFKINYYFAKRPNSVGFSFTKDAYRFENPAKATWSEFFNQVKRKWYLTGIGALIAGFQSLYASGGRCFGMAETSGNYFIDTTKKVYQSNVFSWEFNDSRVQEKILDSHVGQIAKSSFWSKTNNEYVIKKGIEELKLYKPFILLVKEEGKLGRHAILATSILLVDDNSYYINCYDNNIPKRMVSTITVKNQNYSFRYYNYNQSNIETFSTTFKKANIQEYNQFLSFLGKEMTQNNQKAFGSMNVNTFYVTSSLGQRSGFIKNIGYVKEITNSEVIRIPTLDNTTDSLTIVYVPDHLEYTVRFEGDKNTVSRFESYRTSNDNLITNVTDNIILTNQTVGVYRESNPNKEIEVDLNGDGSPDISLPTTENVVTGVDGSEIKIIPNNYNLFNNYPNPFNPITSIHYQIPSSGFISLKVYDAVGREVAVLVNEYKEPGVYKEIFESKNLSSGVYFYRLQAGNYVETKKMILLK